MSLRALIFDFDGLIIDTEGVILRAWQEEFSRHGVEFPFERWVRTNVGTIKGEPGYVDEYDELEALVGAAVDRDAILARRVALHDELLASPVPNPGVREWIDGALDRGLALGVASSSARHWVERLLTEMGLRDGFACVSTRDDVGGRGKPDPAVYLNALAGLGVDASGAVALEDSPPGVAAAEAAGIFTVAVPSEVTRSLDFSHADLVVESLASFTLDDLLAVRRDP